MFSAYRPSGPARMAGASTGWQLDGQLDAAASSEKTNVIICRLAVWTCLLVCWLISGLGVGNDDGMRDDERRRHGMLS